MTVISSLLRTDPVACDATQGREESLRSVTAGAVIVIDVRRMWLRGEPPRYRRTFGRPCLWLFRPCPHLRL
jgi:hypothetical protein